MKSLSEGAHQTFDDVIVTNTVYSWHDSFWRTTVQNGIKSQIGSILAGYK